jgi:hypothetical protein
VCEIKHLRAEVARLTELNRDTREHTCSIGPGCVRCENEKLRAVVEAARNYVEAPEGTGETEYDSLCDALDALEGGE